MKNLYVLAPLFVVVLAGCPVKEECASGFMASGDDCVPIAIDGGGNDAGQDMAQGDLGADTGTPDAGACGMPCTGATPVCDETSGLCVQCAAGATGACTGATPLCDTTANECVACLADSDCTSLTAPQCDPATNACVACTSSAACTGRTGTTVCDIPGAGGDGACVQCTTAERGACGANVCAPATNTCTTLPAGVLQACEECVHDAQCQVGQLCVATVYANPPPERAVGSYCLWRRSAPLPGPAGACGLGSQPFASARPIRSTDGEDDTVCELATTTCPALLQHRTTVTGCTTPFTDDTACGAAGFSDGRCRLNSSSEPRCTYPCLGTEDCRAGSTCPATGDQFCSI